MPAALDPEDDQAADDERRHARDVGAAAVARGGVVEPVQLEHQPPAESGLELRNQRKLRRRLAAGREPEPARLAHPVEGGKTGALLHLAVQLPALLRAWRARTAPLDHASVAADRIAGRM